MIRTNHPLALVVTLVLVAGAIAGLELGLVSLGPSGSDGNATTPVPIEEGGQPAVASNLTDDEGRIVIERQYEDDGLVVIGVHKPEFDYEKDPENIREYVQTTNTTYPIVIDNQDATWDAYDQRAWPTRYLIDVDGFVRYEHVGEGAYDETEGKIQELLAERDRIVNGTN